MLRKTTFITVLSAVAALFAITASNAAAHPCAEAEFLASIPPHATYAQVKRLLPAGATLSVPAWSESNYIHGNVCDVSGSITGKIAFMNRSQMKFEEAMSGDVPSRGVTHPSHAFSPADTVYIAYVVLRSGAVRNHSQANARASTIAETLGSPSQSDYSPLGGPDDGGGQFAQWSLSGRREIDCFEKYGIVDSDKPSAVLELTFDYTVIP